MSGLYNGLRLRVSTFEFFKKPVMRKLILLTIIFYSLKSSAQTASDFTKLQWLVGEWNRTNAPHGTSGNEKWVINSPVELQGWGITMKGTDTAFVEKTKLLIKNGHIYYVADIAENKEPIYFKLVSIKENEFTCENPTHNFPKKITYKRNGSFLKATISGNGKSVDYFFERKP